MSGALDTPTRTRLARILSMLASDFDGEVVTAARMAAKIVVDAGLDWDTVINGAPSTAESRGRGKQRGRQPPPPATPAPSWQKQAEVVVKSTFASAWQVNFCADLLAKWCGRKLSEKQTAALEGAWRKCCRLEEDFASRRAQ